MYTLLYTVEICILIYKCRPLYNKSDKLLFVLILWKNTAFYLMRYR